MSPDGTWREAAKLPASSWAGRPPGVPSTVPPPSVPVSFFIAGGLGLVACGLAFVWARGAGVVDPSSDPVVAATHFGVLSTLAMVILGAMHQFIPVITGRPLRSVRLARATFIGWFGASWMLPLGIAMGQSTLTAASGALAGVAIALLSINLYPALTVRGKGTPVTGLRLAVGGAVLTSVLGAAFASDRQSNSFQLSGHVDLAMAVIGLFGWLGLTYVSVAEKLWPMFFLAHIPGRHRSGGVAVRLIPVGAFLLSTGLAFKWNGLAWGGAMVLTAGLGAHLVSLSNYVRHRRRRSDLHLVFVLVSAAWLPVATALAAAAAFEMPNNEKFGVALTAAAVSAAAGWLLGTLVGHLHKIVPFTMWSLLRSRGIATNEKGTTLVFAELYDHSWAVVALVTNTLGVAGLSGGFASSQPVMLGTGGMLLAVTGVVVGINLARRPIKMLAAKKRSSLHPSNQVDSIVDGAGSEGPGVSQT